MRCCLSEASSSNDYENRTSGLRAQDVFYPLLFKYKLIIPIQLFQLVSESNRKEHDLLQEPQ